MDYPLKHLCHCSSISIPYHSFLYSYCSIALVSRIKTVLSQVTRYGASQRKRFHLIFVEEWKTPIHKPNRRHCTPPDYYLETAILKEHFVPTAHPSGRLSSVTRRRLLHHTNVAAGEAERNACGSTLHEMAHNDKDTGISKDQANNTPEKSDFHLTMLSREKLQFLIQIEVWSGAEFFQRGEMRSMPINLVEEIIFDVLDTGYCATTEYNKNSSF